MKKIFTLLSVFALSATAAFAQDSQTVLLETGFDESLDLPEGWKVDGTGFSVSSVTDPALLEVQSGTNAIAANPAKEADVLFTPVMSLRAGDTYTIEFYYFAPKVYVPTFAYNITVSACTAQDISTKVKDLGKCTGDNKDWKKAEFTFVPETDGEYCFAINAVCANGDSNAQNFAQLLAYDSFKVLGPDNGGGDEPIPGGDIVNELLLSAKHF